MSALNVALTGNPNTGKSTIFNALTGARQHIGNWPGVTVDKKVGQLNKGNQKINIIDLPGTYSLSAYSIEERIVKDYLTAEKPDVVVNVVDASNIERNLYLTVQLLEMGVPTLVNLNMMDEAKSKGYEINLGVLSQQLGAPVISSVATSRSGLQQLIDSLDPSFLAQTKAADSSLLTEHLAQIEAIKKSGKGADLIEEEIIEARYEFINKVLDQALVAKEGVQSWSDKLDNLITNRVLGIPIFIAIMYLMFQITFSWVGQPLADLVDGFIGETLTGWVDGGLAAAGAAEWLHSLVIDGIIAGVGGVLVFVPLIFTLFLVISFLDGTGYMARVAFIMDRAMRRIGLSGKAFLPMLIGFGCGVPAVMGARALDTDRDRKMAVLLTPFMSCGARLPVYALFAALFFPGRESVVVLSLYLLGIAMAIIMGLIFKNTYFKGDAEPFLMELPPYRIPTLKTVLLQTWEKGKGFLVKAGTIIFSMSVVIWILSSYNFSGAAEIQDSLLASIGHVIAPLFAFHGFGSWETGVAVLTGILAKEAVVSTLGVIYGVAELAEEAVDAASQLQAALGASFTSLSAYAFLVFTLLYTPCAAALGTIKKELNSWKWTLFAAGYTFALAWIVSLLVYRVGLLLGLGG
ncbi:ferrous iron transport protein B [Desulforamulus ruminis]|uniref:Ferrous iron transport protein B n=1 Tax=Desulforamulus ruminis (strain ATCC 23193 / DSM 2154 / NCIMB 8452 / DL) TaxID=696281 RepID=F6DJT8_DESRL|nr:ferrous iron transport protein B [Desulforamulus ruminis]AEG59152.1 ferrous iron transport protein B [Desulforamulus ruminis DSM 2154]